MVDRTLRLTIDTRGSKAGAEEYARAVGQVAEGSKTAAAASDRLEDSIGAIEASARATAASISGLSNEVRDIQRDIAGLGTRLGATELDARQAAQAFERLDPTLARVGRTARTTAAELATLNSLQNLGGYGIGNILPQQAADEVVARAGNITSSFAGLRTQALATFGAFVGTQTIVQAGKVLGDYEKALKQIEVIGGVNPNSADFARVVDTTRDLGRTSNFSAVQSAGALLENIKVGDDAASAVQKLNAQLNLAVAGDIELGRATEIVNATLKQFSLDASQANRVSDVLTGQANSAAASVSGLAETFREFAPLAGGLKVPLEDAAAAAGFLADRGIQGSLGGTALKNTLSALVTVSDEGRKALEELGLAVDDVNPEKKGLIGALDRLGDAQITNSQAARIFGKDFGPIAKILADNTDAIQKYADANREVEGVSQDVASALSDTLDGSVKQLKGSFESLTISLGDAGLTKALSGVATWLSDIAETIDTVASGAGRLRDSLGEQAATPYDPAKDATALQFLAGSSGVPALPSGVSREDYIRAAFTGRVPTSPQIDFAGLQSQFNAGSPFINYGSGAPFGAAEPPFTPQVNYPFDIPFGPEPAPPPDQFVTLPSAGQGFGPEQGALDALRQELELRKSLVGATEEQRKIAASLSRAQSAAVEQYGPGSPEAVSALESYRTELTSVLRAEEAYEKQLADTAAAAKKAADAEAKRVAEVQERAQGIAGAVADPLRSGVNTGIRDALEGDFDLSSIGRKIGTDILSGLLDEILVSPIVDAIKSALAQTAVVQGTSSAVASGSASLLGLLLAKGGVVSGGDVLPFAKGSAFSGGYITNGPEYFPLRGGKVGLRGEAGQEAVLPLRRLSSGDLGVRAEVPSAPAQSTGGPIQVIQHFHTPDAESFRRSSGHRLADEKRMRRRWGLDR